MALWFEIDFLSSAYSLVAVIPAYNEVLTIEAVVQAVCPKVTAVIVVDDGSTDGTYDCLKAFFDALPEKEKMPLILLRNSQNRGKAASLFRGFRQALTMGAKAVVTLDGDGQHAPKEINRLYQAWTKNPQCLIIGARLRNLQAAPKARLRANKIADFWVSWAAGHRIYDSQSGFRIYPTTLLRGLTLPYGRSRSFVLESEILIVAAHSGFPSLSVPIDAIYQKGRRASHFRPFIDISKITKMVAIKLFSRGMYPQGLYRSLFHSGSIWEEE